MQRSSLRFATKATKTAFPGLTLPAIVLLILLFARAGLAATPGLHGTVRDPLGATVAAAEIDLIDAAGNVAAHTVSGSDGSFAINIPSNGRFTLRARAITFAPTSTAPVFLSASAGSAIDIVLSTPTLTQEVTVTATGTPTPAAQTGAAVTVLDDTQFLYAPEVQEPLRTVPGVQMTQSGEAGGSTSLFLRGGNSNATKVLVDGVPANDIGGAVNFGNIASVGLTSIEVLRQPNSSLYGSDALAGVVSLTTARGSTPLPFLSYSGDAGNFHTYRQQISASGAVHRFDYFSAFDRLDTRNNLPNDAFHNGTYAGNFGFALNPANELRFTLRHVATRAGAPNSIDLFGIADNADTRERDNYYSAVWNNQATARWHNQARYGGLRLNYTFNDYAPTGTFDPVSTNYLGRNVTIRGANGYSVTGKAIFQYSGVYPSQYVSSSSRDFLYAQSDYRLNAHTTALGSFTYEKEIGKGYTSVSGVNYSYTTQISGDVRNRLFYNIGSGLEQNRIFGFAATPRASLAYYLTRPSAAGWFSGLKLHGSFSKGIKEPSVFYQTYSLYAQLQGLPNGKQITQQFHISPIGPETSRNFDGGLDQEIFHGRVRIGATYFHDEFTNGIEYVGTSGLLQLGFPSSSLTNLYGAAVNSMAFRAQGLELEGEWKVSRHLFARSGYTFLDAVVQRSFSSDNLYPSYNTSSNFSTVAIGAYSPLDGARPFRRAPQSGYFALAYTRSRWYGALSGTLVGKRDDSTYLSDADYGSTLLLPNHNLLGEYQRLELEGNYRIHKGVTAYARVQNLLDERYYEAFGYPALPLNVRAGMTLSFGGESWKLH